MPSYSKFIPVAKVEINALAPAVITLGVVVVHKGDGVVEAEKAGVVVIKTASNGSADQTVEFRTET